MTPQPSSFFRRFTATSVALCAAATAFAESGFTVVLLDETFAEGGRTTQKLPETAAWYGAAGNTLSQPAAGSIVARHVATTGTQVFFHFTEAQPYTLALGESLSVSLDFNLTRAVGHGGSIRIGLLDSRNTRVTSDGGQITNSLFADDRGYGFFFSSLGTLTNLALRARDKNNHNLFTAVSAWSPLANGPGTIKIAADQTYTLWFRVTRTGEGADVLAAVTGGNLAAPISISYSDTRDAEAFTAFDKFGLGLLANATSGSEAAPGLLTISRAKVTATITPPPSPGPSEAGN